MGVRSGSGHLRRRGRQAQHQNTRAVRFSMGFVPLTVSNEPSGAFLFLRSTAYRLCIISLLAGERINKQT